MFFTAITTLLLGYVSTNISNKSNFVNSDIQHVNEETGKMFYATAPDENGNFNPELPYEEDNEVDSSDDHDTLPPVKRRHPSNNDTSDTYVANKSFLSNYYSHFYENFPFNRLGICGYTAISMFLSYYDTYWNDQVIDDKYDYNNSKYISSVDFNNYTANLESYSSPGVFNNIGWGDPSIEDLKNEVIDSGLTDTKSNAYKEKLDRLIMREVKKQIDDETFLGKLYEIGIANGSIKPHFVMNEYTVANSGFLDGIGVNNSIMNNVLNDYVSQNEALNKSVTITSSKIRSGLFISYSKEKTRIRNEIISIIKSGKPVLMGGGGYTDNNNNGKKDKGEGWGHVVVAYEYDEISDVLYGNLGWGKGHTHTNLDTFFNIELSDYWTFGFNSELSQNYTNNYYFNDKNVTYSPYKNSIYNTLSPSEYGFPESYGGLTNEISKTITLPSSNNHTTIQTNRLRTGYIEKECINLSPRREGAGQAFLEYTFPKPVKRIIVDLSFWSASEFTNISNSDYRIEYYINGSTNPFTAKDLWRDVDLPTNRNKPLSVEVDFAVPTYKFRFFSSSIYTSDRNKGRLSIFDMMIFY